MKRILILLTVAMVALSITAGAALATGDNNGANGKGQNKVCVLHNNGKVGLWIPEHAAIKHGQKHGDAIAFRITSKSECKADATNGERKNR